MSSTTSTRFQHQPLDLAKKQIRLFTIKAWPNENEPIKLKIEIFELNSAPEFTALSYTWGEPLPAHDVVVNGKSLTVRQNLYNFLQVASALDKFQSPVYKWADQICIDQSNTKERNHQVGQMAEIYTLAKMVTTWLGSAFKPQTELLIDGVQHGGSDDLMVHIHQFASLPDELWMNAHHGRGDSLNNPNHHAILPSLSQAVQQFCTLNYWSRLWIRQEIILAKDIKILLGTQLLPWKDLEIWARIYTFQPSNWAEGIWNIVLSRSWRIITPNPHHWSSAFDIGKGSKCTDPRDKIYGLLGLVDPKYRIEVDYTLPVEEVLKMIIRKEYSYHGRFEQVLLIADFYIRWQEELQIEPRLNADEAAELVRAVAMFAPMPPVDSGDVLDFAYDYDSHRWADRKLDVDYNLRTVGVDFFEEELRAQSGYIGTSSLPIPDHTEL